MKLVQEQYIYGWHFKPNVPVTFGAPIKDRTFEMCLRVGIYRIPLCVDTRNLILGAWEH